MLYNFTTDFEAGKAFELKTISLLNKKNPRLNTSSDLNKLREYNIEFTSIDGSLKFIEVKYDRWLDSTGNFCIEYAYKKLKTNSPEIDKKLAQIEITIQQIQEYINQLNQNNELERTGILINLRSKANKA